MLILWVAFDSKLTRETHLSDVVATRSFGVMRQAGALFDCPYVLKSCFNAYVLFNLEYCALVWMSFAESHLSFLNSVCSAERLCKCELFYWHRRKASAFCLP